MNTEEKDRWFDIFISDINVFSFILLNVPSRSVSLKNLFPHSKN